MPGTYSDQDRYEDGTVLVDDPRISTDVIDHWGTDPSVKGAIGIDSNIFVMLYASVIVAATTTGAMAFFWVSADNRELTTNVTLLGVGTNPATIGIYTAAQVDIPFAELTVGFQIFDGEAAFIKQRFSGLVYDEVGVGIEDLKIRASISFGGDQHGQPA